MLIRYIEKIEANYPPSNTNYDVIITFTLGKTRILTFPTKEDAEDARTTLLLVWKQYSESNDPQPHEHEEEKVIAKVDYPSPNEGELSYQAGDVILVTQKEGEIWKGKLASNPSVEGTFAGTNLFKRVLSRSFECTKLG
jgi:hypothetical protein